MFKCPKQGQPNQVPSQAIHKRSIALGHKHGSRFILDYGRVECHHGQRPINW